MNDGASEAKMCFVIAPIGSDDSETRKRSDKVLKHIVRPVTAARGYRAVRADEISEPGLITSQVIQRIVQDPLVIADLSEWNPNVFYELALRHALRKPLVQMIAKGERIPFDVAAMRTIEVDVKDLDSVEAAKQELTQQIAALERDPDSMETPLSFTLDVQALRQSGDPGGRSLAELAAAVSANTDFRILADRVLQATDQARLARAEAEERWWRLDRDMPLQSELTRRAIATDPQIRSLLEGLPRTARNIALRALEGARLESPDERREVIDVLSKLAKEVDTSGERRSGDL